MLRNIAFALLVLFFSNNAHACISTPEERRAAFDGLDADHDGFLTLDEYYSGSEAVREVPLESKKKNIAELDTDKDGKINFEEFSAMKQKQRC